MVLTPGKHIMSSYEMWEQIYIQVLERLSPRQASRSNSKKTFSEATNTRASDEYEISAIHEPCRLTTSGMYRLQIPGLAKDFV